MSAMMKKHRRLATLTLIIVVIVMSIAFEGAVAKMRYLSSCETENYTVMYTQYPFGIIVYSKLLGTSHNRVFLLGIPFKISCLSKESIDEVDFLAQYAILSWSQNQEVEFSSPKSIITICFGGNSVTYGNPTNAVIMLTNKLSELVLH